MTFEVSYPLGVILLIVASALVYYLKSYLNSKANNLATREDVAELTRQVEFVRSEFRRREEWTRALLARDATAHRLRLETEIPIYRELWNKLVALDDALIAVRVAATNGVTSDGRKHREAYDDFHTALDDLRTASMRVEPFFPKEIRAALLVATLPLREIALREPSTGPTSPEEFSARSEADTAAIAKAMKQMSDAIQARLFIDTEIANQVSPPPQELSGRE